MILTFPLCPANFLSLEEQQNQGCLLLCWTLKKWSDYSRLSTSWQKQASIVLKLQCYRGSHEGIHRHSICWKRGTADPWTTWGLEVSAAHAAENPCITFDFLELMTPTYRCPEVSFMYGCTGSSLLLELSLVAVCEPPHCSGISVAEPGPQDSWASAAVAHGLSCPAACGIFLDQGSSLCPLHWQVGSYPLCHQGSPGSLMIT